MKLSEEEAVRRAASAEHGILATLRADGAADLVPACFVLVGDRLAIPIELVKPKAAGTTARERNLEADPRATFLCEAWDPDDWSRLWWVRLRLERIEPTADELAAMERGLRARYRQYAAASFDRIVVFRVREVTGWSAA